jgi:hypothetical protein
MVDVTIPWRTVTLDGCPRVTRICGHYLPPSGTIGPESRLPGDFRGGYEILTRNAFLPRTAINKHLPSLGFALPGTEMARVRCR